VILQLKCRRIRLTLQEQLNSSGPRVLLSQLTSDPAQLKLKIKMHPQMRC
jgi:hypothetical protein